MPTTELVTYFTGEKQAAVFIGCIGIASMIFAAYLWFSVSPFRAMVWPLIIIGLVEVAIGVGLWMRTDPQVAQLEAGLKSNSQQTVASEIARMQKVNRSFKIILAIEITVLIVCGILAFILRTSNLTWTAVCLGLALQAALLFVFDMFAEHRADVYTRWLIHHKDTKITKN